MMAKPVSSACNLRCAYCYYAGKEALLHQGNGRMSHEVLEAFIRQNLAMHGRDAVVEFAWHGGEPTLAGLPFYEEAVRLEQKYGAGRRIVNTLCLRPGAQTPRPPGTGGKRQPCGLLPPKAAKRPEDVSKYKGCARPARRTPIFARAAKP